MSERAAYSRVYWSIIDDPKFVSIYDDDHHLAAWLRLLLIADQAHPASAHLPANVRRASVKALVEVGLIDLSESRYRVHGLDAERSRRRDAATNRTGPERDPNGTRPGGKRDPEGFQTRGLSQDKPRQDEGSQDSARDPADLYWQLTGKYPKDNTLSWLDQLTGTYGSDATYRELAAAFKENGAVSTLIGRTQDRLRAGARQLDRSEKAEEETRLAEKRSKPVVREEWREEFRALAAAKEMDLRKRRPLPGDAA